MKFCTINDERKVHLLKLIDWLYKEVISSGGDGDALWYSKYYDIKEIILLVKEYNDNLKYKWKVDFNEDKKLISWWNDQESVLITNNEEVYKTAPSWQQCIIVY